jgi:hypothetical protein
MVAAGKSRMTLAKSTFAAIISGCPLSHHRLKLEFEDVPYKIIVHISRIRGCPLRNHCWKPEFEDVPYKSWTSVNGYVANGYGRFWVLNAVFKIVLRKINKTQTHVKVGYYLSDFDEIGAKFTGRHAPWSPSRSRCPKRSNENSFSRCSTLS